MIKNIKKINVKNLLTKYAIYVVFVVLILAIGISNPRFFSLRVVNDLLLQNSTRIIIALGMMFVLISGGVDLSAGRMVGLGAVIAASLTQNPDYARRFFPDLPYLGVIIPVIIAVLVCALFGFINGSIIAYLKVPAFIATLGSMVIVYGAVSIYYDMKPNSSQPIGGMYKEMADLGSGSIGFMPIIILFAILVIGICYILLNRTSFGKNVLAIGGNMNAAVVSGVKVSTNTIVIYTLAGALYGLAGVLEAARTGGATNNYGQMYELDAIAACVVGGISNLGGIGRVSGAIIGVLIFGILNYGLTFIGLNPYWQLVAKGIIIVAAVALDIRKKQ